MAAGERTKPTLTFIGPMRTPNDKLWRWMAAHVDSRIGLKRWASRDDLEIMISRRKRWMASVTLTGHGCWYWCGQLGSNGITPLFAHNRSGSYRDGKSDPRSAFLAWVAMWMPELAEQISGPRRTMSRTTCRNQRCVNPKHRVSLDAARQHGVYEAYGTKRKVDADQVREIRRLRAEGEKMGVLAEKYGMSETGIRQIVQGLTYKWVD